MSSSTPGSESALTKVATPSPSPSQLAKMETDFTSSKFEMHPSLSDEERRFYLKMYPNVDLVNQRRVHCTVCKLHLGTAPASEGNIKMHPILRVTHCVKCHDFYNSGEFSKGEDGSELYCRWCGQGGEVYCCSTCPYVFCKSCIVKNLSKGVIVDIEQNEHWNCFSCTSKILWPLRAQHWALVNYLQTQKRSLQTLQLPEVEARRQMLKDGSNCCRLAKSKNSSLSDSMESLESNVSKRSQGSSAGSSKRGSFPKTVPSGPPAKRSKASNDEVVCTPDLLSMLEPDCQLSVTPKTTGRQPVPAANIQTTPRIVTVQQNYQPGPSSSNSSSNGSTSGSSSVPPPRSNLPPPLVLSGSGIRYRQNAPCGVSGVVRRTVVPNSVKTSGPVFHTINGFKVDLNSAAQQDSYRLPNGRLIQVKRQLPLATQPAAAAAPPPPPKPTPPALVVPQVGPGVVIRPRAPVTSNRPSLHISTYGSNMGIYNPQTNQQQRAPHVRVGNANPAPPPIQGPPPNVNGGQTLMITPAPPPPPKGPTLVRHTFPNTPMGQARTQLQEQIFSAMDICTHLTGKVVSLTHSNAYNQVRSYLELKELYIHMSYLMTYAIGRLKNLQEKCLVDMREKGFKNDANSLENGQLAAAVDYVCYGQLDDVDLFNTGCNSFHNQVYEYRKSLHANLKDGEDCEPLPPLMPLGVRAEGDPIDEPEEPETIPEQEQDDIGKDHEEAPDFDYDEPDELDDDLDDDDLDNEECGELGTEESMNRNEQAHAYDRKLTRLLREYPSLWCTRHPDYGKKEVTNKQWRVIASHFPRGDDIKLRWKNVRKRFVRIERRLKQGKRFKGYFDKATNYLENRDRPRSEWLAVDCGEDDGDGFERKHLDVIENKMEQKALKHPVVKIKLKGGRVPMRPLEVRAIDQRIITFAKSHPVLWRKSADPEFNSIDEQTRKSLWQNFWKSAPNKQASDDEDNEIEIVEPKTDTITIDSDNEDDTPSTSTATQQPQEAAIMKITSVTSAAPKNDLQENNQTDIDVAAFSSTILASLLEVEVNEGASEPKSVSPGQKKQPRKKTTNKPNPALLQLERQRMEDIKKSDAKLKMKVMVKLRRAEDEFEVARKWVEDCRKREQELATNMKDSNDATPSNVTQKPASEIQKISEKKGSSAQKESTKEHGEVDKEKTKNKEKIGDILKAAIKAKIGENEKILAEDQLPVDDNLTEKYKDIDNVKSIPTDQEKNNATGIETVADKEQKKTKENIVKGESKDKSGKVSKNDQKNDCKEGSGDEMVSEMEDGGNGGSEKGLEAEQGDTEKMEDENGDSETSSENPTLIGEDEKKLLKKGKEKKSEESEKVVVLAQIGGEASPMAPAKAAEEDTEEPKDAGAEKENSTSDDLDIVEPMDTSNQIDQSSAEELVESMDVTEPKELLDCALDEVIAMDGIELSVATEELMKALGSSSGLTSENTNNNETDLDANDFIENLPLETTEPPEILLKEDESKAESLTKIELSSIGTPSSAENCDTEFGSTLEANDSAPDEPATAQIVG